jgi:predicted small lipoprotein YifL
MAALDVGVVADDDPWSACYDSGAMLREFAANPRPLAAAAVILLAAAMLAGCGIKGPLKLPPPATPAATPPAAASPAPAPAAPEASKDAAPAAGSAVPEKR